MRVMHARNYTMSRVNARELSLQSLIISDAPRSNQIVYVTRWASTSSCCGANHLKRSSGLLNSTLNSIYFPLEKVSKAGRLVSPYWSNRSISSP